MSFEIDQQTVQDLELFGDRPNSKSIFSFFNRTKTFGGRLQLKGLMESPLDSSKEILDRRDSFKFFIKAGLPFTISSSQMDFIDHYFRLNKTTLKSNFFDAYFQNLFVRQRNRNDVYLINTGVEKLVYLLLELKRQLPRITKNYIPEQLKAYFSFINDYLQIREISALLKEVKNSPHCIRPHQFDWLFRDKYKKETQDLVNIIYLFDAYNAVAQTALMKNLCLPDFIDSAIPQLELKGLFHPFLEFPIPCDLEMKDGQNLCFLTGPNMAGKSTFLKSLGLSIYLSHLGFPIPAKRMQTTFYNGLMTTINLSDNMGLGHSHFYSEVKRIKEVAHIIREKGSVFVIFDELFRGTNVKDAYEASLYIIKSFSQIQQSTYFISTHITEIASQITDWPNVKFHYFEAKIDENQLNYSYKIKEGVSYERLGMHILRKENIIDILNPKKT
ncbi:MutS-related protein [Echinicola salinicaeni]|uniref:MutS-related protein n=1 Tax=Echinicola salinicaeni TaxID=2762757 RepID=UPI0016471531|nr:hypothetical protein [Echinicola salinicaeni]